jgi:hypothetical protein
VYVKKLKRRFQYVKRFKDRHGIDRWYFAYRDFPSVALPGPEGSRQFVEAYEAARVAVFSGNDVKSMAEKRRREAVDLEIWGTRTVPKCGVYLLMQAGAVTYVGSSTDVRSRVMAHRQNGRPFDAVYAMETDEGSRLAIERMLIIALKPAQNRTWVKASPFNRSARTVQTASATP